MKPDAGQFNWGVTITTAYLLLAQSGNFEDLVARLAFGSEDDARILA